MKTKFVSFLLYHFVFFMFFAVFFTLITIELLISIIRSCP